MVIVGLAFNLILIRVGQCSNTQQGQQSASLQFTSIGPTMPSYAFDLSVTTIESKT